MNSAIPVIMAACSMIGTALAVVKSIKSGQKAIDNQGTIAKLAGNEIKHLQKAIGELKKESKEHDEKLEGRCSKIERDVAKIYTKIARLEERTK
jgi:peptidoglycan hydrolase CwlO-like protein